MHTLLQPRGLQLKATLGQPAVHVINQKCTCGPLEKQICIRTHTLMFVSMGSCSCVARLSALLLNPSSSLTLTNLKESSHPSQLAGTVTLPCAMCCRCLITQQHNRASCSGPYAHQVGPALIKITDLFNLHYLQQPLDCGGVVYARATTLALHLNQEVALLTKMCQQSSTAAPSVHLEQDCHYSVLRSAHCF